MVRLENRNLYPLSWMLGIAGAPFAGVGGGSASKARYGLTGTRTTGNIARGLSAAGRLSRVTDVAGNPYGAYAPDGSLATLS